MSKAVRVNGELIQPVVRIAKVAEERSIYRLLVEMWEHNNRGWGFEYSPEIVIRHIEEGTRPNLLSRSDSTDQRRAVIGVIEEEGQLVATVGLFLDAPMWFVDPRQCVCPTELWFYVSPRARGQGHRQALRNFSLDVRDKLRRDVKGRMPLITGFMHQGSRYSVMQRLWQRLWPRARQVGALFWID